VFDWYTRNRMHNPKTKYMLLSRHQNAGQNRDMKIENRLFGNVSQFVYLRVTVTNQNSIQEEIKRRLSSGNARYLIRSRTFCLLVCCLIT
jgi:hypothetical protein